MDPLLEELKQKYISNLPQKWCEVEDFLDLLETEYTTDNLQDLYRLSHQLKGSSGTYGFHDLSLFFKKIESTSQEWIKNKVSQKDFFKTIQLWREELRKFQKKLTPNFDLKRRVA
jgi:chemotaxis protein histidine kinase CheA